MLCTGARQYFAEIPRERVSSPVRWKDLIPLYHGSEKRTTTISPTSSGFMFPCPSFRQLLNHLVYAESNTIVYVLHRVIFVLDLRMKFDSLDRFAAVAFSIRRNSIGNRSSSLPPLHIFWLPLPCFIIQNH